VGASLIQPCHDLQSHTPVVFLPCDTIRHRGRAIETHRDTALGVVYFILNIK